MPIDKFQKKLLKKLRSGKKYAYEEAALYTILLDLCEGNGIDDVRDTLKEIENDLLMEYRLKNIKTTIKTATKTINRLHKMASELSKKTKI